MGEAFPSDWVIENENHTDQYYFVSPATGQRMVRKCSRDRPEEVWAHLQKAERADRRRASLTGDDREG